jgi:hypothetical protein
MVLNILLFRFLGIKRDDSLWTELQPNIMSASFLPERVFTGHRDSAVGIATGYGLGDQGVGVRVAVGSRIFFSPRRPDRLCGPPNLLSGGYWGLFPRE